ncbi:hypothetical protein A5844_002476 [Enterococcus sp. 10A9_DIV0425]|nr:hypothetical protein A5844_002476 [Enterococcus sp. 10A9_DIV0425]
MDKFKDELKEIATQAKINDSAFTTKVIGEELKAANVKIKDDAFKNILTPFTETSSTASTEDSATQTTESSETKSTDSTKASETKESTTDSTK